MRIIIDLLEDLDPAESALPALLDDLEIACGNYGITVQSVRVDTRIGEQK
jgi:hypothetical protein